MSRGKSLSPEEWFSLIAERAPLLRAAGVTRLVIEGTEIDLAPHIASEPIRVGPDAQFDYSDPLDDPATYGHTSTVPGYRIPDRFTDDELGHNE